MQHLMTKNEADRSVGDELRYVCPEVRLGEERQRYNWKREQDGACELRADLINTKIRSSCYLSNLKIHLNNKRSRLPCLRC